MHEEAGNLILIVEYKAISPSDNRTRKTAVTQTVACDEQSRRPREEPDIHEVQDGDIIAEVE